jgi:hypothetical protein
LSDSVGVGRSPANDGALTVGTLPATVNDEPPARPPAEGLVDALRVKRNAGAGVLAGVALAALAYVGRVFEVVGPVPGTREYPVLGPEGWFLLLGFVLASATALLVTALLTLVTAYRLTRELD